MVCSGRATRSRSASVQPSQVATTSIAPASLVPGRAGCPPSSHSASTTAGAPPASAHSATLLSCASRRGPPFDTSEPVMVEAAVERAARQAERARRLADVALVAAQRAADQLALDLL